MFTFIDNGSVTSVSGIKAAGIHAGFKRKRKDLAIIISDVPCTAAGTFTLNKVKAAPLQISKKIIDENNLIRAIMINSGNANACTGEQGYKDALESQKYIAHKLSLNPNEIIISSTGVIGEYLQMDVFKSGIDKIVTKISTEGGIDAAKAIMTTDLVPKHFAVKVSLDEGEIIIGGIAKGSGMIMPNMATMLAFLTTDAKIEKRLLQKILHKTVMNSFNKISVDGDTSTNDMVIAIANGISGIKIEENTNNEKIFTEALQNLTVTMAKAIVKDGEGASKLITINVVGGKREEDVNMVARTVANSALVKTAVYGSDPNWGRIIAAIGRSGVNFLPEKVEIKFGDLTVLAPNFKIMIDEKKANEVLSREEVTITINLNEGKAVTKWWTCDFTEQYIKINASYRT